MNYYFFKLLPPRPTFPADMTPEEGRLMQQHAAYWGEQIQKGTALVIGPVMDPKGTYGIGVVRLENAGDVDALVGNDPVVLANAGFKTEVYPMPRVLVPEGS